MELISLEIAEPLLLAALQAKMGEWTYYITYMKMRDLVSRVKRAQSLYSSKTMQDLLQRSITESRSQEIADYLFTQRQRFFNALVIGTYGGAPKWSEFAIEKILPFEYDIPDAIAGTMGFLILEGTELLFPIDGQHRVEGIRLALQQHSELGEEEICVIFVPGISGTNKAEDPEGFERTRRLFTTLNRYAKPVNMRDIIALDEDDSMAIITRRLIEEYSLFTEKTSISLQYSINKSDETSFTSIRALYDGLSIYHRNLSRSKWKDFLKLYPGEEIIDDFYNESIELWECLCEHFSPLEELKNSKPENKVASSYRNTDNGEYLLFRPIGLLIVLEAIRLLKENYDFTLTQAIERISSVPMDITHRPWVNILWNPTNKRMMSRNKVTAKKILYYAVGGDLSHIKTDTDELKHKIATITYQEIEDITLRRYL